MNFWGCAIVPFFLLTITSSFCQQIQVLDAGSYLPVPDVSITNESMEKFALTDGNGNADLNNFQPDETIILHHPSYKDYSTTLKKLESQLYKVMLAERVIEIGEIIISANKWEQEAREIPNEIMAISPQISSFNNPQSAADLLEGTGKIFVQKSQLGGGSPMIRGFGANAVLIVVDGVRMNNAIFRSGNLQNIINIDPNMLEGAEVIMGPGSVIYGSDALGGVMDFHTKKINFDDQDNFSANAFLRFSSANLEKTGHFNWLVKNKKIGWFGGFTFSGFDDLRAGSNRPKKYPDFGKRYYYVERIDDEDSIAVNQRPNVQIPSGFNQYNILQKINWKSGSKTTLEYTFNLSNTNDIPRYDRLIEEEDGLPVDAEWFYGPQFWMMNSLKLISGSKYLWDDLSVILARQDFEESRNDRKFQDNFLRMRKEEVQVYSVNFDANKNIRQNEIFYGMEYAFNKVTSTAFQQNIDTREFFPLSTRYPDGGSQTHSFGTYINWKTHLPNDKMIINAGMRYNFYYLHSIINGSEFPFSEIDNRNQSLNGNIGLVFEPISKIRISLLGSTGYRAPNVDDVAKIFDSEPGNVVVPNPDLKPEDSYNLEGSINWKPSDNLSFHTTLFHSWLKDAMVRDDFTFNGQDSIEYDGAMSKVQAYVNTGKAVIYGIDLQLNWEFADHWGIESYLNIMKSKDLETGDALRHTTPVFGKTSLFFKKGKTKLEVFSRYNGRIKYEDLPPSEQSKPHIYPPDGSLAWATFNIRGLYSHSDHFTFQLTVENMLDKHYRTYSSGISAPGLNFIFSVKTKF